MSLKFYRDTGSKIRPTVNLSFNKESVDVVTVGKEQQRDQNDKADGCGPFHEFVARFAAGDHLYQQEEHMSAVESRNGQNVHKGQCHREEGGNGPE